MNFHTNTNFVPFHRQIKKDKIVVQKAEDLTLKKLFTVAGAKIKLEVTVYNNYFASLENDLIRKVISKDKTENGYIGNCLITIDLLENKKQLLASFIY